MDFVCTNKFAWHNGQKTGDKIVTDEIYNTNDHSWLFSGLISEKNKLAVL